jgi:hypothetical protein
VLHERPAHRRRELGPQRPSDRRDLCLQAIDKPPAPIHWA